MMLVTFTLFFHKHKNDVFRKNIEELNRIRKFAMQLRGIQGDICKHSAAPHGL